MASSDSFPNSYLLPSGQIYKEFSELGGQVVKVYHNQYNVGIDIVKRFVELGVLPQTQQELASFKSVNMMVLGPSFTALRDQTNEQIEIFKREQGPTVLRCVVINSSSLGVRDGIIQPGSHASRWLDSLRSYPTVLHILVHDEAHFGIRDGGIINTFLNNVASTIQTVPTHKLLVLCVSATMAVLLEGVPHLRNINPTQRRLSVDWNQLRLNNQGAFGTPHYRGVNELTYRVDRRIGQIRDTQTTSHSSEAVMNEYIQEAGALRYNQRIQFPFAREVIASLAKAQAEGANMMAVVRLKMTDHAHQMKENLQRIVNFRVLTFLGEQDGSPSLQSQLGTSGATRVADLTNGVYLIIVVDRLRVGECVPPTCFFWDVRCRYKRSNGIHSLATFIQDVGRCAGHNKPVANVFVGVDHNQPQNILSLHSLLEERYGHQLPVNGHPEFAQDGVYTLLQNYLILLVAEPQIGKTGAILAMADIINDAMLDAYNYRRRARIQQNDTRSMRQKLTDTFFGLGEPEPLWRPFLQRFTDDQLEAHPNPRYWVNCFDQEMTQQHPTA